MTEQIRILVVDDDEAIRELLLDYLGGQGYRVEAVADSVQMRAWLAEALPDLVLLDVGLPGEDGLSLARYLREHHDLPVIMVSGAGTPLDRIVGLEVGADDYLAKPFDPRELLARVKTVLRRYRRAPAAASPADPGPRTRRTPSGRSAQPSAHPAAQRDASRRRRSTSSTRFCRSVGLTPGAPRLYHKGKPLESFDAVIPRIGASITFYGCALAGVVMVPIVHFYGPKEVRFILERRDNFEIIACILLEQKTQIPSQLQRLRTQCIHAGGVKQLQ